MRTFNPGFTCHPPLFVGWNNNDKSASIQLTGGQLVASPASVGDGAVRATVFRATGKYYAEINFTSITGGDSGGGLANASAVLEDIGAASVGAFTQFKSGNVYKDGSVVFSNGNMSGGGILRLAYDADGHLGWLSFAGGNWNGNAAFDPSAGTGGQNTSVFDSGGLFPMAALSQPGEIAVLNAGATSFSFTVPSGFLAWNTG